MYSWKFTFKRSLWNIRAYRMERANIKGREGVE